MLYNYLKSLNKKKVIITLVSVILMGLSLSVLNIINYGTDSFTYMNLGISEKIRWSLGNWQLLINVCMFIVVIICDYRQIGIGTLFNMILVGYIVDFFSWIWVKTHMNEFFTIKYLNIFVMLLFLIIFVFSAATYMSTDLGTAPFDALPLIFYNKHKQIPFKLIRFIWDLMAVIIGFIFSRHVGIVTVLMVIFLGQTAEFVRKKFF